MALVDKLVCNYWRIPFCRHLGVQSHVIRREQRFPFLTNAFDHHYFLVGPFFRFG